MGKHLQHGDPAGGALTGTYPNPTLSSGGGVGGYVDLTTTQTIGGAKTFTHSVYITAPITAGVQLNIIDTGPSGLTSGAGITGILNTVPTGVGHRLGFYLVGANASNSAGMSGYATEVWTAGTAQGTELRFQTTPNGAGSRVTAMTIGQDKVVTLVGNITPTTTGTLSVGTSSLPFGNVYTNAIKIVTGAANGYVLTSDASGNASWVAGGTVSTASVVSANGFSGTVATPTTTPAITITTSVTGMLKGNGTAISAATAGTDYSTSSSTETLTNKRITKRVLALSANSATPAINTDNYDVVHITAQTAAITSFTSGLTGTPVDGDTLRVSITGTASVALTWGATFASSTVSLPTTTSGTNRLDVGFFWNTETSKWRCVAVA